MKPELKDNEVAEGVEKPELNVGCTPLNPKVAPKEEGGGVFLILCKRLATSVKRPVWVNIVLVLVLTRCGDQCKVRTVSGGDLDILYSR